MGASPCAQSLLNPFLPHSRAPEAHLLSLILASQEPSALRLQDRFGPAVLGMGEGPARFPGLLLLIFPFVPAEWGSLPGGPITIRKAVVDGRSHQGEGRVSAFTYPQPDLKDQHHGPSADGGGTAPNQTFIKNLYRWATCLSPIGYVIHKWGFIDQRQGPPCIGLTT